MMENKEKKDAVAVRTNIGDEVIKRVDQLQTAGFNFPADYNYVNAIKASMLVLNDVKDRNGHTALTVCTPNSVSQALFKMVTKGLDVSKKQGYFICRGDVLCFEESYFGTCVLARRASKHFEPIANVIYEDDEFEYGIDPKTGRKIILKHVQKLENIDKPIVGAYAYVTNENGETDVEIMTKKQIDSSWAKSTSREQAVHKAFPDRMARRTVIKRAANMLINSTLEDRADDGDMDELSRSNQPKTVDVDYTDFEEPKVIQEKVENQEQQDEEAPSSVETKDLKKLF